MPPMVDAASDAELEPLVVAALAAYDTGGEPALTAELAAHGEHAPRVRRIVERMIGLGLIGAATPHLPENLGGYRVRRELGRGGMGVVYEVEDATGGAFAMKVVRTDLLGQRPVHDRFRREVEALTAIDHPAIVPIVASGVDAGLPWFVMPLLAGRTVHDVVEQCRREGVVVPTAADLHRVLGPAAAGEHGDDAWWRFAVRALRDVAAGVEVAHRHGVVHRDIKPGNVMLRNDGRAQLLDFGLATMRGSARLTRTGIGPGSPAYMAPEQVRGEPADERTDVYGLAVTLWSLLACRDPFPTTDEAALLQRIANGDHDRLSPLAAPPALRRVLACAMDRDRQRRHATAGAFAADLEAVLTGRSVAARSLPWREQVRRFAGRHRVWIGAALAMLAVLPCLLGLLWWREQQLGRDVREQKARADAKIRDFDLLAGVLQSRMAVAAADALHPAWPERRQALQAWLQDVAAPLLARQPQIVDTVATLQRAAPAAGTAEQFLLERLQELVVELETLRREHVPDVQRRLRWADWLAATAHDAEVRRRWDAVRAALARADDVVASQRYAGRGVVVRDEDFVGLVPIGMNPMTKLWEFYDLRSAWDGAQDPATIAIPSHAADGSIAVGEDTGVVFVLVPGGQAWIGAQASDPNGRHFDAEADPDAPVTEVVLDPYLIARHELTQGQWARLCTGSAAERWPSHYRSGQTIVDSIIDGSHPVEHVSWTAADRLLRQHGMRLPTEAQWEVAARAGTSTPWWSGSEPGDLDGIANLLDQRAQLAVPEWGQGDAFDDGFVLHAPVGRLAANAFGLHDVHGNVWEWCRDTWCSHAVPAAAGDGERGPGLADNHAARGGCFSRRAESARSSVRFHWDASLRSGEVGLRPVRALRR